MAAQSYQDLEVWQKAMDAAVAIYRITKTFPSDERFGLTSQVRRSVSSIAANIAEGKGRLHQGDFLRFLSIARGSLLETETHLLLASRLGFVQETDLKPTLRLLQEAGRLLNGLIRSLRGASVGEEAASYAIDYPDPEDLDPDSR